MNHANINDPAAILEHTNWLRSLARQLVSDPNTADDVVQSTLIAAMAWEGKPREGMRSWLAGVARNVARQIRRGETRRNVREAIAAVPESIPSSEEMVELVETQRWLAAQVLELEEPYRSTIYLRYLEELAPVDIAKKLGIPSSTVRVRLKRGLSLLRERLEESNTKSEGHWSLGLLPLLKPTLGATVALAGPTLPLWVKAFLDLSPGTKAGGLAALTLAGIAVVQFAPDDLPEQAPPALVLDSGQEFQRVDDAGSTRTGTNTQRKATPVQSGSASEPVITQGLQGMLTGQIFDGDGLPASGALVTAVQAHTRTPQTLVFAVDKEFELQVQADEQGRYSIPVEPNHPHLVRALYPGWAPQQSTILFAGEAHDLFLEAGQSVVFNVQDASKQMPVAGAHIQVHSVEPFRMPLSWSFEGVSDELGQVSFEHLPLGPYAFVVESDEFAVLVDKGELSAGESARRSIHLTTPVTLTGIVLDSTTREPLVGARVQVPVSETVTDHRGEFSISGLDPSAKIVPCVAVYADGYPPAAEYLNYAEAGPKPHLTFEMRQWVHLYGRVIDEVGRAVGNQRVSFAGRFSPNADRAQRHDGEILTDSEGRFVMPLHYRAQYAISAKMPGFAPATVHVRNFDPNIERIDLDDLVLRRPASISGKVLGRTYNRRIPDTIQVDLMNDGDFRTNPAVQIQRISITPDGEFTVGNLGPGTYSLTLLAAREESSKTDPLVRKSVKVEAGEAIEGITLTPIPPISGSVRLADGTPVSRVRMTIQSKKEGRPIAFVITDKNGEFSMAPEGDGPFILTAADRGFEFHQVQLEDIYSGMSGLSFVLLPRETEFSIQGRIVDAQGRAINGIHLRLVVAKNGSNLSCEAERDTSGNFTFKNLDEQLYSIHATDPQARFNFHSIYGIPTNGDPVTIQMERRF